ncbi:carboxymuconolactone decarboxylase family protein [Bosea caraganae]|uniref:Carboxymuconolactone decarboxylase family protein n=1 Tax=Bosea caraganae TaxID=2763117 RepID=A0A370LD59_9HYPH|nr:carboxymuconolactone decarboxylase family protein [Bosea caraganae]RDJ27900.1 carboxymuconolactone decarboxylase family protein [Bosea caraganae]RDJ29914.1 carboxymuconolactone decarboxylase family protein [Bosea caraganae]
MTQRLNAYQVAPAAYEPVLNLSKYVAECGLEHSLLELVKLRASQINRCAYCLHMHAADARKAGETEARIYLLDAWEESGLYSARERAALRWTEALTRLADAAPGDEVYAELRQHFSEVEAVNLSVAIGTINVWNRINAGFRTRHPQDRRRDTAVAAA